MSNMKRKTPAGKKGKTAAKIPELGDLPEVNVFCAALLRAMPFGMEIVDENGTILYMNENLEEHFGQKALGKKCWELYKDDKEQCPACPLRSGIQLEKTESIVVEHVFGGRVVEISHTGMTYQGKKAILEIFQDVTERRKIEEIKDEFVNTISHELRTPLAIVKESIYLISAKMGGHMTDPQRKYFEIAMDNMNRLGRLISDILDYQKLLAGKSGFDIKKDDMNKVVEEIKRDMSPIAEEKKIEIKLALDKDLPKAEFDKERVIQVLMNLVNNALKFTEEGRVTLKTERSEKDIHISITDTGIGIKEEEMGNLFKSFTQMSNRRKIREKGSGLGLVISQKIVEQHSGKMWASSECGKGSTFSFSIPIKQPKE